MKHLHKALFSDQYTWSIGKPHQDRWSCMDRERRTQAVGVLLEVEELAQGSEAPSALDSGYGYDCDCDDDAETRKRQLEVLDG